MKPLSDALSPRWLLAVLLLSGAIWFYRSPYSSSDLEIVPDSEEYAIGAMELLETGNYHITIEGNWLPPRYPPWFSAIAILPAYVVFGRDLGNAVIPVALLAIGGVAWAWAIGRRISGSAGGIFAAVTVLTLPGYSLYAGKVMTDVPCAALMLATCAIYLQSRARPELVRFFLSAGIVIALTTLFRTLFATMLLPFFLAIVTTREARWRRLLALLTPTFLAAAGTLTYNVVTFGSPLRNGYKYWVAVPLDYLSMAFSSSNIPLNLRVLWNSPFPTLLMIVAGLWLLVFFRKTETPEPPREELRHALTFLALAVLPISAIHLFYFFPSDRFFLPLLTSIAVVAGAVAAMALGRCATSIAPPLVAILLLLVTVARLTTPQSLPYRRLAAERLRKFTANNAIIISALDPVYLERFTARGTRRRIVPLSRNVEYASKLLVPKRIADPQPPPRNWRDTRAASLIRGGAEEAVKFVANEQLNAVSNDVARGVPVYLDVTTADVREKNSLNQLWQRFTLVPRAPFLYQLAAR